MSNKKKVFLTIVILFSILSLLSFAQAQTTNYQFTINNNGDETEVYELSVDRFSDYVTFSENPVSIGAGKSQIITLESTIPCENEGKHGVSFNLYGQKSKKIIEIPFDINVASCYGYEVQIGEKVITTDATKVVFKPYEGSYEFCKDEKASIPILITNKNQAKNFKFNLEDIDFAKLSGKKLSLQANQKGVLYIDLLPLVAGDYDFNLSIATDETRKIPISLKTKNCYSVSVDFGVDNIAICGCEPYAYDFLVTNNGIKKEEIGLKLEGPDWISLGLNQNFELESGKSISVGLNIDAPCKSKKYAADIIAYLTAQPDIRATDSIGITILSKDDCYETRIETDDIVKIDYNGTSLPVRVTNYGTEQIVYSIVLEGPEWIKMMGNNTLSLEPEETKIIDLGIRPGEDVEEGDYDIKINLNSEKASHSKDIEIELRKKSIVLENITGWYGSYKNYVWIIAGLMVLLIIPAYFLIFITGAKTKTKKKSKRKIKREWMIWLLIILISTALAYLVGTLIIKILNSLLWQKILWFRYYIYTIIIVIAAIYLISMVRRAQKKKKKKLKKSQKKIETKKIEEKKKSEKKSKKNNKIKRKHLRYFLIIPLILILAGILFYFFIPDNSLLQHITGFLLLYYPYIIAGIILLVILILLLSFGMDKNKKQKSKKKN